jgi:RNA polymerase sigma-70 factor (ECF subfamily)
MGRKHLERNALSFRHSSGWPSTHSGFGAFRCKLTDTPATIKEAILLQFQDFDEAYVGRLRAGDFRTQEHFVTYFSELIQLKLRSRLRTPEAIEDVRQETFARVFSALRSEGGIRQPERLGAFVNSICNNVLLEHYRFKSRDNADEPDPDLPDPVTDVLGIVAARQMQEKVRQILGALSDRDRRLIKAIFLDERDKDEVCQEFAVDRDYLRVLIHRAKQSFKSCYLKNIDRKPPGIAAAGRG